MDLHKITKIKGNKRPSKRVGRGGGSGKGWHTTGRGQKGQKARVGYNLPIGFEGGQVPLFKRLPMIGGFRNHRAKRIVGISLDLLNHFREGATVEPKDLVEKNIIKQLPRDGVKILGSGKLEKKLTLKGFLYSASAKKLIEKSGSTLASL